MVNVPIRLIEKETDLTSLDIKPFNWDVVMNGRPYYVGHVPGYVHSIRGWGEPIDLWCWPRDEKPSYENLLEYNLSSPVAWGLRYRESRYIRSKWDDNMMCSGGCTVITRNGEDFYDVRGGRGYSVPKALALIEEIQDHPLEFNTIDFDKKMIGRKIWFRSQPAIITRYIKGQCCAIIEPDGMDFFKRPAEYETDDLFGDWYDERDLKIDIIASATIDWFRG